MGGLAFATLALAFVSWKYVEKPFRDLRRFSRRAVFSWSAIVSGLFIGLGLLGHAYEGFPSRKELPSLPNYTFDNRALRAQSWGPLRELSGNSHYGVDENQFDNELWFTDADSINVLLVGNSYSKDFFNILASSEIVRSNFEIARFGSQITPLANPNADLFRSPNYKAADVVVIVSRYDYHDIKALPALLNRIASDGKEPVVVSQAIEYQDFGPRTLADSILERHLRLQDISEMDLVELARQINSAHFEYSADTQTNRGRMIIDMNRQLREIAEERNILFLDRVDYLCDRNALMCFAVSEDLEKYFYDKGHTTLDGARFLGQRIDSLNWLAPLLETFR
jgi:hypothetical protein